MSSTSRALRAPAAGSSRSPGWMPFALVALVIIPAAAGTLRLIDLAGGARMLPADPRMTASPVPVVAHILSAVLYAVLGAFQFSTALRRRHLRWHRRTGRAVVVLGLVVALSALWMTTFYPRQPGSGELAQVFRLAFATMMGASIVLALVAVRGRDIAAHQAWMTRAYALALGAGTQTVTLGAGPALFGAGVLTHDLSLGAAWVINLIVAELVISRQRRRKPPSGRLPALESFR